MLRRLLLAPPAMRSFILAPQQLSMPSTRRYISAPRIMDTSFWANLVPKPLRKESRAAYKKKPKSQEWNPATFFIFIFLLIGSNAMQLIAMKRDFSTFIRRADAKIGLLREIIERIQNGEEVDVEGLLGTGDKEREHEWEEVLQEIEKEEASGNTLRFKSGPKPRIEPERTREIPQAAPKPNLAPSQQKPKSAGPVGFY